MHGTDVQMEEIRPWTPHISLHEHNIFRTLLRTYSLLQPLRSYKKPHNFVPSSTDLIWNPQLCSKPKRSYSEPTTLFQAPQVFFGTHNFVPISTDQVWNPQLCSKPHIFIWNPQLCIKHHRSYSEPTTLF